MQKVTVTFDLFFDVRRTRGSLGTGRRTEFSFTAGGMTQTGVSVPGWPPLRVGDTVTALLRKEDDWSTLVGWLNHDTGDITLPSSGRTWRRVALPLFGVWGVFAIVHFVFTVNALVMSRGAKNMLLALWIVFGIFVLLMAVFVIVQHIRLRRDVRALEDCLIEARMSGDVEHELGTRPAAADTGKS